MKDSLFRTILNKKYICKVLSVLRLGCVYMWDIPSRVLPRVSSDDVWKWE